MNKLQALYDNRIGWKLFSERNFGFSWELFLDKPFFATLIHFPARSWGTCPTLTEAVDALWLAARKYYPKAECFKGEK